MSDTAAHQDARSMGFSRQEHWSGEPSPSPIVCDTQGIKEMEVLINWLRKAPALFLLLFLSEQPQKEFPR